MTPKKNKRGGKKPSDGMTNKEFDRRLGDFLVKHLPVVDPNKVAKIQRDKEALQRYRLYLNTSKLK